MNGLNYFGFAFGGTDGWGENFSLPEIFPVDFAKENVQGYGMCFKNLVGLELWHLSSVKCTLNSTEEFGLVVEFKTVNSGETPEKSEKFKICVGDNVMEFNIPPLSSDLQELVFAIHRKGNKQLPATKIHFTNFECK